MAERLGTVKTFSRFANMANEEQLLLWRAAVEAIGSALRHEFGNEPQQEVPDKIRQLLAQLENERKPKGETD
jgi:hypothetical protein